MPTTRPNLPPLRPPSLGAPNKSLRPIHLGGTSFLAHHSGCLLEPSTETLIVSDLHLGKGSSYAQSGQLLPPYDSLKTLKYLTHTAFLLQPQAIIALGDSFHDAEAVDRLGKEERSFISALTQNYDWTWVTGNHDQSPPTEWDAEIKESVTLGDVALRHEPSDLVENEFEICGHFHPKARVKVRAMSTTQRCFCFDSNRAILPAFGAYTGGLNARSEAIRALLEQQFHCYLLGKGSLYLFSSANLLAPREKAASAQTQSTTPHG